MTGSTALDQRPDRKDGTVGAYPAKFGELFPQGLPIRDFGYYATELRGSVPLSDQGDAGTIAIGTNVLEFQLSGERPRPEGRELLGVEQPEVGERYFVYVTNTSGLYRYETNDIIEVTGHDHQAPRIRFVQRGKGLVSFTGEKLYEVQLIAAVDKALGGAAGPLPVHRRRGRAGGCHQRPAGLPDRVR